MRRAQLIAASLLVIAVAAAATQIYRWVDEKGNVHYGDQPPDESQAELVRPGTQPPPATDPDEAVQRAHEQLEAGAARRASEREARASATLAREAARAASEQSCTDARTRLAILQEQRPVYRDDQGRLHVKWDRDTYAGPREYLDDAARVTEVARAREAIGASCRDPDDAEEQQVAREAWVRSELCATAQWELEQLQRPGSHTPRSELERGQRDVERFCNEGN